MDGRKIEELTFTGSGERKRPAEKQTSMEFLKQRKAVPARAFSRGNGFQIDRGFFSLAQLSSD